MKIACLLLKSGFFIFSASLFFSFSLLAQTKNIDESMDTVAIFRESGEYSKALDILKHIKGFNEDFRWVKYQGELEFLSGNSKKALTIFSNLNNKDWQDYLYLGLVYEDLNQENLAVVNYLKSLKLRKNSIAYFRLGKIYRKKHEYKQAIESFSSLVEFDPSLRLAYFYLGECFFSIKSYQQAYKFFSKAINFYPKVKVIQEKLKKTKERLGSNFFITQKQKKEDKRKKVKLSSYSSEAGIPLVRVGLARGLKTISFFCGGKFLINDGENSFVAAENKFYTFIFSAQGIILRDDESQDDCKTFLKVIKISSLDSQGKKFPFYISDLSSGKGDFWHKEQDRAYWGDLEISVRNSSLNLVNILNVEKYLYGVLSAEISSKAHFQALKAQAVAARTFTFRNLKRHKNEGFDFCSQVHCQVYQGVFAHLPATIRAVDNTKGEVVVYKDKPIEVFFHANCGGCLAADVFGQSDYLVEKPDAFDSETAFCFKENESKFRWQRVYDAEDFFIAFGNEIRDLKYIILKRKGDCSHYKEMEVITLGGRKELKGDLVIRNYFDHLRSSAFKVEKKLSNQGYPVMLFFWGSGFGHGAGMCQDGAVRMAEDKYDYLQILSHYFPNTRIKKLYFSK